MKKIALGITGIVLIGLGIYGFLHSGTPNISHAYDKDACAGHMVQGDPCLNDYYGQLVDQYDEKVAIADLKQRYSENPYVEAQCHPIMHTIGAEASKKYPSVSEAYQHGDVFCWSGYYHGVMEGVVGRVGEAALPTKLNTICADIPGKASYNFDYFNCVHGLGHGIMELKEDNLFDSLAMCDNLSGDWEQQSCQSGVFMENIISFDHLGTSNYLKKDEPLYPCTAVKDKYKFQCYLGQTSYALQTTNYDFTKVSNLCTTVAEPYRDICFQSFGRDVANQAGHDAARTKTWCAIPTDPNDIKNCVIGAVKEFISYFHSDKEANAYCNIQDDREKMMCLETGAQYYKVF